ncbi:MAG: membrane protein insertion efficiency factor YidD [Desulfuromonadales bacterium]|nr:membrane protein insertion efficiency factor YidD [Desulfuromonadales bacterium]MBN2791152.1 membrane protein insertion efficiency factor YidD [Desulfuromonadales bacterium]
MKKNTPLYTALVVMSLVFAAPDCRADSSWEPWEVTFRGNPPEDAGASFSIASIRFFQKYLSAIDGPRCSMDPTCSAYALQAIRRYGFALGSLIFVDRLYHEGDLIERQTPVVKHGYIRFHDPLENNTFWLQKIR